LPNILQYFCWTFLISFFQTFLDIIAVYFLRTGSVSYNFICTNLNIMWKFSLITFLVVLSDKRSIIIAQLSETIRACQRSFLIFTFSYIFFNPIIILIILQCIIHCLFLNYLVFLMHLFFWWLFAKKLCIWLLFCLMLSKLKLIILKIFDFLL
jgi:hypothetical protein